MIAPVPLAIVNFPASLPAVIVYATVSPTSGSVADTVPTAAFTAAFSEMVNEYVDAPNEGTRLHALVLTDSTEVSAPQSATYTVPSP